MVTTIDSHTERENHNEAACSPVDWLETITSENKEYTYYPDLHTRRYTSREYVHEVL